MGASDGAANTRPAMGRTRTGDLGLPRFPMIHVTTTTSARLRVDIGPARRAHVSGGPRRVLRRSVEDTGTHTGPGTPAERAPNVHSGSAMSYVGGFPKGTEVPVPSIPVFVGWVSDADL